MSEQNDNRRAQVQKALLELFSGYRAEWLKGDVFRIFTEPSYFPQLVAAHPCVLMGGRGTGKTTALRCLSYQGQKSIRTDDVSEWPFFGMYYRVNTNRVKAFTGQELSEDRWIQLFAHYCNLELCELALAFLEWFSYEKPECATLSSAQISRVGLTLNVSGVESAAELREALESLRLRFEASLNNIGDKDVLPFLSMQGAPVDQLLKEMKSLPQFKDKSFFFLIDEFENLEGYQQRVANTLIKHCGELYSFKIGVREFGFRERSTLNPNEQLIHPADYKLIDITEELSSRFSAFATQVCMMRFRAVIEDPPDVRKILPTLSAEDEADLLGVRYQSDAILQRLLTDPEIPQDTHSWLKSLHPLEIYALHCRASADGTALAAKITDAIARPEQWQEQYGNYKVAYLFTIKRGKPGIRKYFAGWDIYCSLASANIRYLLELVAEALTRHLELQRDPWEPIEPLIQTRAAHATGSKNLRELEGLALSGAKLTRLLLGLGRVFQVMAEDSVGHTPEVTQFHLTHANGQGQDLRREVDDLLTQGVMHLALVRYQGSKLQERSDIRQWDYAIHPIFSPLFGFSHRRKRKIELSDVEIQTVVDKPKSAIRAILARQNRVAEDALPEQMELFADYYAIPHQ